MILTAENYYSSEADREYLSVSQYKSFCGSLAHDGCEAKAMSQLMENWIEEKSTPVLVGSYVDAYFEGTLDTFKSQNQDGLLFAWHSNSRFESDEITIRAHLC